MDTSLMEVLLNEEESNTLDFKRDQYPFEGASDDQKSELLKDILAFANAWRREDAYILIGVDEVKGGRSIVVGVTDTIDESRLQQFVNNKTNKPVNFSYRAYSFEGKQIAVVRIPVQERPLFTERDFGRVKKDTVYLRRGSSTAVANPSEIARMGADSSKILDIPSLNLQFVNHESGVEIGTTLEIESRLLLLPEPSDIPRLRSKNPFSAAIETNADYYEEFGLYLQKRGLLTPVVLTIKNTGSVLITNARLQLSIPKLGAIELADETDLPQAPWRQRSSIGLLGLDINPMNSIHKHGTFVDEEQKKWLVSVDFGNIQPKAKVRADKFYVSLPENLTIDANAIIYADNLPDPFECTLTFRAVVNKLPLAIDKLIEIADRQLQDE